LIQKKEALSDRSLNELNPQTPVVEPDALGHLQSHPLENLSVGNHEAIVPALADFAEVLAKAGIERGEFALFPYPFPIREIRDYEARPAKLPVRVEFAAVCLGYLDLPGNAGTTQVGENISLDTSDNNAVVSWCRENKIDLVVVAPDDFLAAGMVDVLDKAGINAFGPTRAASEIEWSKSYAKDLFGTGVQNFLERRSNSGRTISAETKGGSLAICCKPYSKEIIFVSI